MDYRSGARLALLVAAAAALPRPALAKSITMSVSPSVELRDGALAAKVRLSNSGDDVAQSVVPVLRFRDKEARGAAQQALGPNQSAEVSVSVPAGELAPGRWPFSVAVDYTDANQYPFQAVHVGLLTVGDAPPAKLAIPEVKAEPLAGSGSLRVKVKNLAGAARKVTLVAYLPEAIEATKAAPAIELDRWAEATVAIPVVNRTALAGSRFPIFVAAEYDDQGVHQTVLGVGTLDVVTAQSRLLAGRTALWLAAAVLVLGWLGFLLARALRTGRAAPRA